MRNFVDNGDLVTVTAPSALITGTPVQVGSVFGVAHSNAAAGSQVSLRVRGRYEFPKLASAVLRAGDVACWNGSAVVQSGSPIGYVSEDALAGTTKITVLLTGTSPAVPQNQGVVLDGLLRQAPRLMQPVRNSAAAGDALIWWPLREQRADAAGAIVVADHSGQISGTIAGGTRRFGAWPGVMGDGSTRIPMTGGVMGGFTAAAMRCANFASLVRLQDQITIWGVMHHGPNVTGSDRCLLSWGATQDSKGGWAVGLGGSRERFYASLYPKGVATPGVCKREIPGDKVTGSAISPTPAMLSSMTAVAFEFAADVAGYVTCNMFIRPVGQDYGVDIRLQGHAHLALVPAGSGGSAAANHDVTVPFVIGARATTNGSTFTDNFNNVGIAQAGIMRGAYSPTLGARLVRELAAAPRDFPASAAVLWSQA